MSTKALLEAVEIAGGQSALARLIGVKQQNIWYWINKPLPVPAKYVLPIHNATGVPIKRLLASNDNDSKAA